MPNSLTVPTKMATSHSKATYEIDNLIRVRETTDAETPNEKPFPPSTTFPSQPAAQGTFVNVNHHFDGERHWNKGHRYLNPTHHGVGLTGPLPPSEKTHHRDILGRITQRPRDLLRYISPTYGKPAHLIVQAAPQAYRSPQGGWRRVKLKGTAPTLLRLSIWALGDGESSPDDVGEIMWIIGKVILAIPAQLCVVAWPFTRSRVMRGMYPGFPSRSWDYPKYARNSLDASPCAQTSVSWNGAIYDVTGEQTRLIQPRQLMINYEGTWTLSPGTSQPYIVISYTTKHFKADAAGRGVVEKIAEQMAREAGVDAYWLDYKCRAAGQPMLTDDVHRLCDVFRGARQVCVVLPDLTLEKKREWGCRMWTLTEVLLSASPKIKFCSPEMTEEHTKLELAAGVWTDGEPTRLLAEHYSGLLNLSRLELISLGLKALSSRRSEKEWTPGDIAYALMALLRYRPRMNPEDSLFQALARLSLANDSDRIVERMVCMLPDPTKTHHSSFVLEDVLGANLWDIEPLCQVAGVGNGNEIILDACRAVSIRWKDIPRIEYVGRETWKKLFATLSLRSGPYWFLFGIIIAGRGLIGVGVVFLLIGLALVIASPWSVIAL